MNYDVSGRTAGETVKEFRTRRLREVEEEVERERQRDRRQALGIRDNQYVDKRAIEEREEHAIDWEAMGL